MEDVDEPQSSIEYVPEQLEVKGAALEAFSDVFARFKPAPESASVRPLARYASTRADVRL